MHLPWRRCYEPSDAEPYCRYEVRFEFTCQGEQRTFEITDGIIQVGRRFQADIKSLIKSPDEL